LVIDVLSKSHLFIEAVDTQKDASAKEACTNADVASKLAVHRNELWRGRDALIKSNPTE
jgi:hypothetical protein